MADGDFHAVLCASAWPIARRANTGSSGLLGRSVVRQARRKPPSKFLKPRPAEYVACGYSLSAPLPANASEERLPRSTTGRTLSVERDTSSHRASLAGESLEAVSSLPGLVRLRPSNMKPPPAAALVFWHAWKGKPEIRTMRLSSSVGEALAISPSQHAFESRPIIAREGAGSPDVVKQPAQVFRA